MYQKGKVYKTRGGWDAIIVWVCENPTKQGLYFYAIHRQGTVTESPIVCHRGSDGRIVASVEFLTIENKDHVCDLISEI